MSSWLLILSLPFSKNLALFIAFELHLLNRKSKLRQGGFGRYKELA
jgi:hypothetical protein